MRIYSSQYNWYVKNVIESGILFEIVNAPIWNPILDSHHSYLIRAQLKRKTPISGTDKSYFSRFGALYWRREFPSKHSYVV